MKNGFGLSPSAADFAFGASIGQRLGLDAFALERRDLLGRGDDVDRLRAVGVVGSALGDVEAPARASSISWLGVASTEYGASVCGSAAEAAAGVTQRPAKTGQQRHGCA